MIQMYLNEWVPDQGFALMFNTDCGSSQRNEIMDTISDICGTELLYATPGRHQSTGGVERSWREFNKHIATLNIDWNEFITGNQNDRYKLLHYLRC